MRVQESGDHRPESEDEGSGEGTAAGMGGQV